jgi:hypothetical protein
VLKNARRSLATYLTDLLASGRVSFTREQAIAELAVTSRGFLAAAKRISRARRDLQG